MARRIRSRLIGGGLILGYHSISEPELDPFSLCVSPRNFLNHLTVLQELGTTIPLEEMVGRLRSGRSVQGLISITFDDGYQDCVESLITMSDTYGIPATVFVISGALGKTMWWDQLSSLVEAHAAQPLDEKITLGTTSFSMPSDHDKSGSAENRLMLDLFQYLSTGGKRRLRESLDELRSQVPHIARSERRIMNEMELRQVDDARYIEIGSHSESHPFLASLSSNEQQWEILTSKGRLESLLGKPVKSFSYPHGSFDSDTVEVVKNSGFAYACSSTTDTVRSNNDHFSLPRLWVGNWKSERFLHAIGSWVGHSRL